MGTKNNPGKFDCYAAAASDTPLFTLVANDITAPPTILFWALQRARLIMQGTKPGSDIEKIEEAFHCAIKMIEYKGEKDESVSTFVAQVEQAIKVINTIRGTGTLLGDESIAREVLRPTLGFPTVSDNGRPESV